MRIFNFYLELLSCQENIIDKEHQVKVADGSRHLLDCLRDIEANSEEEARRIAERKLIETRDNVAICGVRGTFMWSFIGNSKVIVTSSGNNGDDSYLQTEQRYEIKSGEWDMDESIPEYAIIKITGPKLPREEDKEELMKILSDQVEEENSKVLGGFECDRELISSNELKVIFHRENENEEEEGFIMLISYEEVEIDWAGSSLYNFIVEIEHDHSIDEESGLEFITCSRMWIDPLKNIRAFSEEDAKEIFTGKLMEPGFASGSVGDFTGIGFEFLSDKEVAITLTNNQTGAYEDYVKPYTLVRINEVPESMPPTTITKIRGPQMDQEELKEFFESYIESARDEVEDVYGDDFDHMEYWVESPQIYNCEFYLKGTPDGIKTQLVYEVVD